VRAYELEIELLPEGQLDDLRMLNRLLTEEYGLLPQPTSKFERAMSLNIGNMGDSSL
jgi:inorganic triphosphatase YgiF